MPDLSKLTAREWDYLVNTTDQPAELMTSLSLIPTASAARRYLNAATASRTPRIITQALNHVDQRYGPEVTGARLMALGQLGQPELVLATPMHVPREVQADALEDACDQALARGIAARTLRQYETAHGMLNVALFLSHLLGMIHKEQLIRIELGQLLTMQGRPDPEMLEETMSMPVQTSARRRAYGMYALAEACMAVGDYLKTMKLLETAEGPQADLWSFAAAMLGVPSALSRDVQPGTYTGLAQAVWALRNGSEVDIPTIAPNSPEAEYGTLLQATALMRVKSMVRHARRKFESLTQVTPDQDVWRLIGRIHIEAVMERDDDVLRLNRELNAALQKLRFPDAVLSSLRALMPEAYLLTGLLPGANDVIASTLTELPILTGEGLTHRYAYSKLPGKASGSAVMVRAAATHEDIPIHRQARERVQDALESRGVHQVVNIGNVIALLHRLREAASPVEKDRWQTALQAALEWVDSDVLHKDLRSILKA